MATIVEAQQEGSTTIRVKTSDGASLSFPGRLIGYGPQGLVSEMSNMVTVYAANKSKVDHFAKAQWPEKRWSYGDYCR